MKSRPIIKRDTGYPFIYFRHLRYPHIWKFDKKKSVGYCAYSSYKKWGDIQRLNIEDFHDWQRMTLAEVHNFNKNLEI